MTFDTQNSVRPGKFVTSDENEFLASKDTTGSELLALTYNVEFDDSQDPGTLLHTIPLDPTITEAIAAIAAGWIQYSISEPTLNIQAYSPMANASGGAQIAHITDPLNNDLDAGDKAYNYAKVIRQAASTFIRSRDSVTMKLNLPGRLYTRPSSDKRMSSFGNVVTVLRAKPSAGDKVAITITFTAVFNFHHSTVSQQLTVYSENIIAKSVSNQSRGHLFCAQDMLLSRKFVAIFRQPLTIRYEIKSRSGNTVNKIFTINSAVGIRQQDPNHFILRTPGVIEGKSYQWLVNDRVPMKIQHSLE